MHRDIVLSGERVALATMTEADQAKFCVWLQSDALRDLIDDPRVPTLDDQLQWFKRIQKPDRKFFSLVTMPEMTLVGNCGFVEIDDVKNEAVLRITIGNPDFRGKGLGTEAVSLLLQHARTHSGWKRVTLKVLKSNIRALRTYEKSGFRTTGEETKQNKPILTMSLDLV